jgi:hypothetical protein
MTRPHLSSLGPLVYFLIPEEGFETQLGASCLSIPLGMRTLGMTRQIRDSLLQRGLKACHVPALQGLDNRA